MIQQQVQNQQLAYAQAQANDQAKALRRQQHHRKEAHVAHVVWNASKWTFQHRDDLKVGVQLAHEGRRIVSEYLAATRSAGTSTADTSRRKQSPQSSSSTKGSRCSSRATDVPTSNNAPTGTGPWERGINVTKSPDGLYSSGRQPTEQ